MIRSFKIFMKCQHCGVEEPRLTPCSSKEGKVYKFTCSPCADKHIEVSDVSEKSATRCGTCRFFGRDEEGHQIGKHTQSWRRCGKGAVGDKTDGENGQVLGLVYHAQRCHKYESSS